MTEATGWRTPGDVMERVLREVRSSAVRTRNGIKVITGSSRPRTGLTPKDIVWSQDRAVMWRYRSESVSQAPPLLIVYSLVSKSYILDLVPGNSFVEHLRDDGFDVFMIDWGIPTERDSRNGLEDYASATSPQRSTACETRR